MKVKALLIAAQDDLERALSSLASARSALNRGAQLGEESALFRERLQNLGPQSEQIRTELIALQAHGGTRI